MKKEHSDEKTILLRLYAAHSALFAFVNSKEIISYVERVISTIPGVDQNEVYLVEGEMTPEKLYESKLIGKINVKSEKFTRKDFFELCVSLEKREIQVYPIKTANIFFGLIAIKVSDLERFLFFDPVVNSFAVSISIILENRYQKNQLEISNQELIMHRKNLTKMVEAQTISLNQANQKLEGILDKTVETIALITEERDPYTAGHQYRVAKLAEAIAKKLGLSNNEIHEIYLGALIHDIGKIHVPSEILVSPAKLTPIEFELIKTHPEEGAKIALSVPFSKTITDIILHHHERLDGSGYPHKLNEGEILFATKIVTVADVFEAMSSHRPYRPKCTVEETLDELSSGAGKHYDTQAVNACVELITKEGFSLPPPPYLRKVRS